MKTLPRKTKVLLREYWRLVEELNEHTGLDRKQLNSQILVLRRKILKNLGLAQKQKEQLSVILERNGYAWSTF